MTTHPRIRITLSGERSRADMVETLKRLGVIDIEADGDDVLTAMFVGDPTVISDLHGVSQVQTHQAGAPTPYFPKAAVVR